MVELIDGKSEKEIAAKLGLSVATVHEYVQGLYRALEVETRAELLASVIRFTTTRQLVEQNRVAVLLGIPPGVR